MELVSSNEVSNLLRREADIALRMVRPDQASLIAKRIGSKSPSAFTPIAATCAWRGTPRLLQELLAHDLVGGDRDETLLRGFAAFGYPVGPERSLFAPMTWWPTGKRSAPASVWVFSLMMSRAWTARSCRSCR